MKKMLLFISLGLATSVKSQFIDFPDPNLKNALVSSQCVNAFGVNVPFVDADTNNDGEIDMIEAAAVTELYLHSQQISSLGGLEYFTNLESLNCGNNLLTSINAQALANLNTLYCLNNQLTSLDLHDMTKLVYLDCSYNQISELNIQGLGNLIVIRCTNNQLTELNVGEFKELDRLYCSYNQLTSLDLNGLSKMEILDCNYNQLNSLQVQDLAKLEELKCSYNQLASLELQDLAKLKILGCSYNQLSSLEVQGLTNLAYLSCSDNQITSLDMQASTKLLGVMASNNQLIRLSTRNGNEETMIDFSGNPDLTCICCDESEYLKIEDMLLRSGNSNITISFDCDNSDCPAAQPNNEIFLYPNPVSQRLWYFGTKQIETVEILDMNGRVRPRRIDDVLNSKQLYVGDLESGTYILKYFIDGKAYHAKFVKQ